MQLMLHLSMDAGCDSGSQLLGAALEGADELSKLIQQRVPGLLFSYFLVLQVSLELLDICNSQKKTFVPSVPAEMVRAGIQLEGSTRSPAGAIAEPAYEHGREGRRHKPCFGLCYTNLKTLLPASPSMQGYMIQQQRQEFP